MKFHDSTQAIELSYEFENSMFKYPSDEEPSFERTKAKEEEIKQGIYCESRTLLGESSSIKYYSGRVKFNNTYNHQGTHIDAPAHKFTDGRTIDSYPPLKFFNSCALVDLTGTELLKRERREIRLEDIEPWFKEFRYLDKLGALIFYTGFCDEMHANNGKLSSEEKKCFEKTFPFFSIPAANYIVERKPDLNIVGIDSFSVDPSGSNSEAHRIFFSRDILLLETLYNLLELKQKNGKKAFGLISYPPKYKHFDAAPTGVLAILSEDETR